MGGWLFRLIVTSFLLLLAFEYCFPNRLNRMIVICGLLLVLSAGIWIHWFYIG